MGHWDTFGSGSKEGQAGWRHSPQNLLEVTETPTHVWAGPSSAPRCNRPAWSF